MKWFNFKTNEEKWAEKLNANKDLIDKHKKISEQFEKNLELYQLMMVRNDIINIHGREYIITAVTYHHIEFLRNYDAWYERPPYYTISLKLIDDDPKMQKEITIDIDDFERYMGWDKYKDKHD